MGPKEMGSRPGYVYIMASGRNGTIYLGVTSNLPKRVWSIAKRWCLDLPSVMAASGSFGLWRSKTFRMRERTNCV
jgi:hypothetical protein